MRTPEAQWFFKCWVHLRKHTTLLKSYIKNTNIISLGQLYMQQLNFVLKVSYMVTHFHLSESFSEGNASLGQSTVDITLLQETTACTILLVCALNGWSCVLLLGCEALEGGLESL